MEDVEDLADQPTGALNRVNRNRSAVVRRAGLVLLLCGIVMIPWSVYVIRSLPRRSLASHYDLAWGGFDILLTAALLWTAYQALSRGRWLSSSASSTATLLIVDAWFDVVTAPQGSPRRDALLSAAFAELPMTLACLWLSVNAQQFRDSMMLQRFRERRRRRGSTTP